MRTKLVMIGNSRGVRIPKAAIAQYGLGDEIELDMEKDSLVIRPIRSARQGWDEAFAKMHERGDDQPLDPDSAKPSQWDRKEWTW